MMRELISALVVATVCLGGQAAELARGPAGKIPVILDTDIGDDIDDTWALGFLLRSPELDVKLVVGDHGKALYRAKLLAKFLEVAGRTDIPVGIGLDVNRQGEGHQSLWVADYNLNRYPGKIYPDGVRALVETVMNSAEPVTVIAIGPLPNIRAALAIEPRIAERARFVGMHGSIRVGYGGSKDPAAEYNVKEDIVACREVFSAKWPVVITPLDTCGLVHLRGDDYRRVRESTNPVSKAIIENYRIWSESNARAGHNMPFETQSTTLFDTVAVYLAFSERWLQMEELGLRVDDRGFTVPDPASKKVRAATAWTDRAAFERFLSERLAGN
ncbi:MAG: nucleoside hydrolase [Verrucomicrobiae bacterium]|nr:nucleoside hydrolase [Verrucomicrobiae bacterium]